MPRLKVPPAWARRRARQLEAVAERQRDDYETDTGRAARLALDVIGQGFEDGEIDPDPPVLWAIDHCDYEDFDAD